MIDGKPNPDRTWTECFAQLVGTVLSLWDAAELDAAGENGEVLPKFINLTDASIKMVGFHSRLHVRFRIRSSICGRHSLAINLEHETNETGIDRLPANEVERGATTPEYSKYIDGRPESILTTFQLAPLIDPMDRCHSARYVRVRNATRSLHWRSDRW